MTNRPGAYNYRRLRAQVLATHPPCWLCGQPGADQADHVVPVAAGGTDTLDNLRPAHAHCNKRKGARVGRGPINRASRVWT